MENNKKPNELKPVILDEPTFRNFLDNHENLKTNKQENDRVQKIIQDIKKRFSSELNSPDIVSSLNAYQSQLDNLAEKQKELEESYKQIEKNMFKILHEANGAPVIWRNIQGNTVHTFTIVTESGGLAIKTSNENI